MWCSGGVDEQAQVVGVRRRRSRAEVEQVVAEYEDSGLGCVEFCRRRGLSLSTLARYRKRRAQTNAGSENRWLAVEVSGGGVAPGMAASRGLAVVLVGGRRIEVGRDFDAATLMRLLHVLEHG